MSASIATIFGASTRAQVIPDAVAPVNQGERPKLVRVAVPVLQSRLKHSRPSMLNIAIGHGMDARRVGRYRVGAARPTDGVAARTGAVAETTTGAAAGTTT